MPPKEAAPARGKKDVNAVHAMKLWKDRVDQELSVAAEWEENWGFLKHKKEEDPVPDGLFSAPDTQEIANKHGDSLEFNPGRPQSPKASTLAAAPGDRKQAGGEGTDHQHGLDAGSTAVSASALADAVSASHKGVAPGTLNLATGTKRSQGAAGNQDLYDAEEVPLNAKLRYTINRGKTPKERQARPLTTSQEVGWRPNVELFGVSQHGIKRDKGIWPQ